MLRIIGRFSSVRSCANAGEDWLSDHACRNYRGPHARIFPRLKSQGHGWRKFHITDAIVHGVDSSSPQGNYSAGKRCLIVPARYGLLREPVEGKHVPGA